MNEYQFKDLIEQRERLYDEIEELEKERDKWKDKYWELEAETAENEKFYNGIVEKLSTGNFLQINGKPINLEELNNYINAQQQEIERLNNIINELEKWLDTKEEKETIGTFSDVLDKLKELKENK